MFLHLALYLICGLVVGVLNAVAGGGSIILFPLLMSVGLSPLLANTTMSLIVLPGTATAVYGYRKHIAKLPLVYYFLLIPSFIGSIVGAMILVRSPSSSFEHVAPIFMGIAGLLLALQPYIHKRLYKKRKLTKHHLLLLIAIATSFFIVAAYGGYFGAGFGIIILGLLGLTPLRDLQEMNGLKNLAGLTVGVADTSYYIAHHLMYWQILPLFIIGNLVGGYVGAHYGTKLPAEKLRVVIVGVAILVTGYMVYKFYL